jgi:phage terminase small subunit
MSLLKPDKYELYAQARASGMTQADAYAEAGYKAKSTNACTRAAASRLDANVNIIKRVAELKQRGAARIVLTKQFVLEAAIDNLEKARGLRPIRIGSAEEPKDVYVYEGAVANAALRMLGAELGMFADRKDVRLVTSEYAHLTDEQLAQKLVEIGQQVLLGSLEGPMIEDGIDLISGSPSVSPEPRRRSRNL